MKFKIISIAVTITLVLTVLAFLYALVIFIHQTRFPVISEPATVLDVRREDHSYFLDIQFTKEYEILCEYERMQTYVGEPGGRSSSIRNAFETEEGTRSAGTYFIPNWEIVTNESIENIYAVVTHSCFGGLSKIRAVFMLGSEIDDLLIDTPN